MPETRPSFYDFVCATPVMALLSATLLSLYDTPPADRPTSESTISRWFCDSWLTEGPMTPNPSAAKLREDITTIKSAAWNIRLTILQWRRGPLRILDRGSLLTPLVTLSPGDSPLPQDGPARGALPSHWGGTLGGQLGLLAILVWAPTSSLAGITSATRDNAVELLTSRSTGVGWENVSALGPEFDMHWPTCDLEVPGQYASFSNLRL